MARASWRTRRTRARGAGMVTSGRIRGERLGSAATEVAAVSASARSDLCHPPSTNQE
ncbi:MAG: hypothetical protein ACK5LS_06500 [Propioniciclava sp.]